MEICAEGLRAAHDTSQPLHPAAELRNLSGSAVNHSATPRGQVTRSP